MLHRLSILALFLSVTYAQSATYPSNGSSQNIQTLINQAVDGDTITVPQGTFTWITPIIVNKSVTIRGVGSGVTLQHQLNRPITWQTLPAGFTGPCAITDAVQVTTDTSTSKRSTAIIHGAGTNTLLQFTSLTAPQLIGLRFTVTGNAYIIRDGLVTIQDCWFRKL